VKALSVWVSIESLAWAKVGRSRLDARNRTGNGNFIERDVRTSGLRELAAYSHYSAIGGLTPVGPAQVTMVHGVVLAVLHSISRPLPSQNVPIENWNSAAI